MFFAPGAYSSSFYKNKKNSEKRAPALERGCLKLRPLSNDKFRTWTTSEGNNETTVTFEYLRRPGWFIRVRHNQCFIEKSRKSVTFEKDCSFFPLVNLWYPDYVTFESVQRAAHYLRMKDGRLVLDHYDGSVDFKEEASFKMSLKSGLICSNNGIAHDEEGRISVQGESVRAPSATSDCVCSDCVSIVSFQIYEETSRACECSDCETEFTTTTTRKDSKDSK
eukprot:Seg3697.2 transcript_id=Seg3697.2/GoldUCD/mRNA.D3Y31 product="hypothetical protein" protein_id=Seg3697.2/GoldUCD/D3Y31